MSRAIRRQQARESKGSKGAAAPTRAIPRTGPSRPTAAPEGGALGWRPRFFMDIYTELRKVNWPTRDDVTYLTVVVVIVTIVLGALLGAIDIGFGWLIDNTLLNN